MPEGPSQDVTRILRRWADGDASAEAALFDQLYDSLRALARSRLARERADHTLQPTALVHEAWLKLSQGAAVDWRDRAHFIAVAARAMRQILVDAGRRRRAQKRDGRILPTAGLGLGGHGADAVELLDLDEALQRLEALQPEHARIVELRYFGGLSIEEAAAVMDVSVATVNRGWRAARAWLYLQLKPGHPE
jgi:RNA polymerase sigma factor (TIGR02999 family)